MEISARSGLWLVLVVAAALLFACLSAPNLLPLLRPGPAGSPPAPTVTYGQTSLDISEPAVTYLDESLGWDWQADCGAEFRQFITTQLAGEPIADVKVVLVDRQPDRNLPFGVRYPDSSGPKSVGNCYNLGRGAFTCYTAVAEGAPGVELDVVVAANAPYTLLDMSRARGPEPNAVRQTWSWGTLQPLISPVGEDGRQWQSNCLHVSRTP